MKIIRLVILSMVFPFCSEVSKENQHVIDIINIKVNHIDANRRSRIVEDDFHLGDSLYKIRGYFMDDILQKVVGVLHTPTIERDDYFYFENHAPIFSGHILVNRANSKASEYKFYYGADGYVDEALFWEDFYEKGKQFPHEHFHEFSPNKDSLRATEEKRLQFFLTKLDMEGFEIRHLNENLSANIQ